jgi:Holliday junction resolvase RusA-like endonuclease
MTTDFSFFVEMKPQAKGRPRFARGGRAYTDAKTRKAEDLIAVSGKQEFIGPPREGPLLLEVDFYFNPPKSMKEIPFWRDKRPDLDNLLKTVKDSMQPWAFNDDAQVVCTICRKLYVRKTEQKEGIYVVLRNIAEPEPRE